MRAAAVLLTVIALCIAGFVVWAANPLGGNHAQFGDYGPQPGDGDATIGARDEQEQAAAAIESDALDRALPRADRALYRSKAEGRNRVSGAS